MLRASLITRTCSRVLLLIRCETPRTIKGLELVRPENLNMNFNIQVESFTPVRADYDISCGRKITVRVTNPGARQ